MRSYGRSTYDGVSGLSRRGRETQCPPRFAMRNQEDLHRCQLEAITMFSGGALGVRVRVSLISIAGI